MMVAMNLAIPLMVVEAFGRQGLDNLLIPIGAVFLLQWLLSCSLPILVLILVCCFVATLALSAIRAGCASAPDRAPSEVRKPSPETNRAAAMAS
jgi:hypothetical protein